VENGLARSPVVERARIETKSNQPQAIRVSRWIDPALDILGNDPRSDYLEQSWLPVIGPSASWLIRNLARSMDIHPGGFDLDLDLTARQIGLGQRLGRQSPLQRALRRLVVFGLARFEVPAELGVRRFLPPVSARRSVTLPSQAGNAAFTMRT
jgi:hypothetical protein